MTTRNWYRFEAKAGAEIAEIYVFDEIGRSFWNDNTVTAKKFIDDLKNLPESVKTIRVHVNSPGGDPFEAIAIANALRAQRTDKERSIEVHIEGLAASAATIITSAGGQIFMADNALFMIHEPRSFEAGTADEMRTMAATLDRVRDAIVATYRWVSNKTVEELQALMSSTTWMNAEEAKEAGFVTDVVTGATVAACFDPAIVNRLGATAPERVKARLEELAKKPAEPPAKPVAAAATDVLTACSDAGLDLPFAQSLIAANATIEDVRGKVQAEKGRRTADTARREAIAATCALAKMPELAEGYIKASMSPDDVKAHIAIVRAKTDGGEIDPLINPVSQRAHAPALVTDSYSKLNGKPTTTKKE